jgi:hypothetical protein
MSGSSLQNKYIKFGGIALVFFLSIYVIFQFTERVYNQYSASIAVSSMERFLVTHNPNVCLHDEQTMFCKKYELEIYEIFNSYVITKDSINLQRRKNILGSILLVNQTRPGSLLSKAFNMFPKETFKEESSLLN